jgi:hypothetical protein
VSDLLASDMPSRSPDGQAALDIFYLDFNDVNFYVEDSEQENLYEVILRKFFPAIRISRIFPLGGKEAVLQHAADIQNHTIAIKKIYLLDKDFDDLLNNIKIDERIVYLDRYCIENYFIEEDAVVEVVIETHPKVRRDAVRSQLKVSVILEECAKSLLPLFSMFLYVQRFNLGLKNCDSKPEEYCHPKQLWVVRSELINQYLESIKLAARHLGIEPPLIDIATDERLSDLRNASLHAIVSGKFLLAMIFHYIKSKFSLGSISYDSFRFRLAKNCQLQEFEPAAARIRNSLASQT